MRDRLASMLAVLFLATGLALAMARPAAASTVPGPPDSSGYWGMCNVNYAGGATGSTTAIPDSGSPYRVLIDVACQVAPGQHVEQVGVGLNISGSGGYLNFSVNGWDSGGYVGPTYNTFNTSAAVASNYSGNGACTIYSGNFTLTGNDLAAGHLRWQVICSYGGGTGLSTAGGTTNGSGGSGGPYTAWFWAGGSTSTHYMSGTFTASNTSAAMPSSWFTGGGPEVTLAVCTFTTDLPSGGDLAAGATVHVTITYSDGAVEAGQPNTTVSQVGAVIGEVTSPDSPAPPDGTWVYLTRTASPQTVTLTVDHAGTYYVSAACNMANDDRITAGSTGPDTTAYCTAHPTSCDTRPTVADCLPTSSGGLFGIIGTVLDPQTYVKASMCMARALFEPGPETTTAIQGLWTTALSRAPFSYLHDALTFLPSSVSAFASGLSGDTGGCLINVPGAGCASIGSSSDLSLVRSVLLFLFVALLTLAVVRTTMRVANGG